MNRDVLAYIAMSIFGAAAIYVMAVGVRKGNIDALLVGILIGSYAVIIGTATSVKAELKQEIKRISEEIKNLRDSFKTN